MAGHADVGTFYEESVPMAGWLRLLLWAAVAGCAVAFAALLLLPNAEDAEDTARITGAIVTGATGVILLLVARWFAVLSVQVGGERLRAAFGPWGVELPLAEVDEAAVEPYPSHTFMGWGVRVSTGRRRAYSVPFVPGAVRVRMSDGRSIYVSSRQPDRLRAAIDAARGAGPNEGA